MLWNSKSDQMKYKQLKDVATPETEAAQQLALMPPVTFTDISYGDISRLVADGRERLQELEADAAHGESVLRELRAEIKEVKSTLAVLKSTHEQLTAAIAPETSGDRIRAMAADLSPNEAAETASEPKKESK